MADQTGDLPERESMDFDVVIVGAGPAGLSAAIALKQQAALREEELSVVVLEKGSEVGAHILSGAVIDPIGLDRLIPDWREKGAPVETEVTADIFKFLGPAGGIRLPNFLMPPLMNNHGNYIISLGNLCRWLAEQAEALEVEIFPGFAAAEMLYDEKGAVVGVATGDMGVGHDGKPKDGYMRGMELRGKYVLLAEGVRGSLSKQVIKKFELDKDSDFQKYGIGLKELWEIDPAKHQPGTVQHSMGWPLDSKTGGGSFLYHFGENLVSIGFVVHLNYQNPHLSPFDEFQRFKLHPDIKPLLEGGKRISYGARAISEGGFQSVPKLTFKGGVLLGCAAGMLNVPRIKGSHNAMLSGILAAEAVVEAIAEGRANDELTGYETRYRKSPIYKDLKRVRNVKPLWSKLGTVFGVMAGGVDMWLNSLLPFFSYTFGHGKPDYATLKKASEAPKIAYPKPDGKITFDKLSSVFLSGTNHEEDQPVHLQLEDPTIPIKKNLPLYDEPAQRYCPAGVYEVIEDEASGPYFQINAQNCVHCKTCDIKDPAQNINWVTPEGGGGPTYPNM